MQKDQYNRFFSRLAGRNGASFYFSTESFANWKRSLEFYRAVSFSAKLKRLILLLTYPFFAFGKRLAKSEAQEELHKVLSLEQIPELDFNCSAMISPTHDKAIIHHHGAGYEKIAVGKSFSGVVQEADIYNLLQEKIIKTFTCSAIQRGYCSEREIHFFMKYADGTFSEAVPSQESLLEPLLEFFSCAPRKLVPWSTQWNSLKANSNNQINALISSEDQTGETPVGLVHRDFKPWNVKFGKIPLFFDFESASLEGCPLEDLFNYRIDPLLRQISSSEIWHIVQQTIFPLALEYLKKLELPTEELPRYWHWYLLERTVFWQRQNQYELANKFLELYNVSK